MCSYTNIVLTTTAQYVKNAQRVQNFRACSRKCRSVVRISQRVLEKLTVYIECAPWLEELEHSDIKANMYTACIYEDCLLL